MVMVGTLVRKLKEITLAIFLCILLALPATAQYTRAPVVSQGSSTRAIFLEHYMMANGTVVQGTAPFRSVNFPTYWYNENTGQLNGEVDFPVNSSLIMVFGDVITLKGNFGAGTGNKLYGVYSLPVMANQDTIYSMDMSGNVVMGVNNTRILLKPGESYSYTQNETLRDNGALVNVQYNHTYINHGFIDKKNIAGSMVSLPSWSML